MKDTLLKFFALQENAILAELSVCWEVNQRTALYYWQIMLYYTDVFLHVINE